MKQWRASDTFRVQAVKSQFTLDDVKLQKQFKGSLPLEKCEWQIGLIVGRSGTGKTSIAKELFPNEYVKELKYNNATILDDFNPELSIREVTKALCSVGFASPPDWLKRYEYLSQGEKMRVDVARALTSKKDLIVFDEFTSVVDRDIAQISCVAVSKAVRRSSKKFIAVTCHYDVEEWLQPDWVFYTDTMTFSKKKDNVQKSELAFLNANNTFGSCLGSIII